jgi:hypothetical protein
MTVTYDSRCADCSVDTSFETGVLHYYSARKDLWRQATPDGAQCLCLDCLERRIGRAVTEADFLATPVEIMTRFAGQEVEPLPSAERQRELNSYREFQRHGGWRSPAFKQWEQQR